MATARSDVGAGRVAAIHSLSGQTVWSLDFDAPVESTPVIGDVGECYVGDNAGKIHAVSAQGQRLWSEDVGAAVRSAGSILPLGHLVFGLDDGSLVALRCSSTSPGPGWPKLLRSAANRCPPVD